MQCARDEDLRDIINNAIEPLGFSNLSTLHNTRARMTSAMCRNAFVSGEIASDTINSVLNKFRTNDKFKLEELVYRDDTSKFMEWAQITVAKHEAGDSSIIFARFRIDID